MLVSLPDNTAIRLDDIVILWHTSSCLSFHLRAWRLANDQSRVAWLDKAGERRRL